MIFCYDAMGVCQRSNTSTTGGSLFKFTIHGTALRHRARLAQSVEHQTFNLRVEGSSPSLGALHFTKYRDLICAIQSRVFSFLGPNDQPYSPLDVIVYF